MNSNNSKVVYAIISLPIIIVAFFAGMYFGQKNTSHNMDTAGLTNGSYVTAEQFEPFWKAWRILDEKYVTASSTNTQDKIWGSVQGLASSYKDPYTVFFPPQQSKMFQDDISGNFSGVGMEIGIKNNQLLVIAPLKGSPAELAGVKAGDAILKIDGTTTDSMSTDQAVNLIRGPKGTTVTITFLPIGASKPIERKIERQIINIPTLDTDLKPGGVFVIKLYSFTAQSPNLFRNALRDFVLSGDHKLILDLRGNPGGYLDAAWDMASYFLPAGKIVVTEDFGGKQSPTVYRSKGYDVFSDKLRMVILVNEGSASASEILAGALRENNVAKLVGEKTFGKGSVQELIPITDDTSLKVTIARWLTPNGHNLSHDGLDPDYKVTISEKDIKDIAAGKDPQMEKALSLLSAQP